MGGNCPVQELLRLQEEYNLFVYIDDAHGVSIIGKNGEGYARNFYNSLGENTIIATSLGKGFGASGGMVMVGNTNFEDFIRRYALPYAFSVGGNIAAIGAALGSVKVHKSNELIERQLQLQKNIAFFDSNYSTEYVNPILPIRMISMNSEKEAITFTEYLLKKHQIYVSAVFFPTVPQGKPALRISLSADHQEENLLELISLIEMNS